MRVLVVEDEAMLAQQLRSHLSTSGYVVDVASDGAEGQYLACTNDYDLAIVDLGLPELDGVSLIAALRQQEILLPVMILTARSHWRDKVQGLEAGADDYLTKPFQMEELIARVNALIRRAAGRATPIVELGPLTVNTSSQQATLMQQPLELTGFEYKLLTYLAISAGRVVSKAELTEHLYAQDFDRDSNVLEVLIGRLRRKLTPHELIQTVRGQGYRLISKPEAPSPSRSTGP